MPAVPQARANRWVRGALLLLAAFAVGGGLYILAAFPPTEYSFYPRCQFHAVTGWHCPGCGTTRGLHALLNGRFAQAMAYNALIFVLIPVVVVQVLLSFSPRRKPDVWPDRPIRAARWPLGLVAAALLYGAARNLPWAPFTALAPHDVEAPAAPAP